MRDWTTEQIQQRVAELEERQAAATSWGAAVGAREEELRDLCGELARRERPPSEIEKLRADLDAARARVEELEAAQAWQPIETAPKDGTEILLAERWGRVTKSRWVGAPHDRWVDTNDYHPLAWRSLPKPPGATP